MLLCLCAFLVMNAVLAVHRYRYHSKDHDIKLFVIQIWIHND